MKKSLIMLMLIALWSPTAGWAMEINGDFNSDKKLTMEDVFIFKDILLNRGELQFTQNEKDINNDGNIDIADLAYLIKMVRNQKEGGGLNVGIDGWEDSGEDWGGTVQAPAFSNNAFNTVTTLDYQEDRDAGFCAVAALPYNESVTIPFLAKNHSKDDIIAYKVTINFQIGEEGHPFSFDRFDNGDFIEVLNPNENIYYETVLESENNLTIICFSLDNSSVLKANTEEVLFRIRFKYTFDKHWEETEDERIWGRDEQFCGSDFTLFNHPYMDVYIKLKLQDTYKLTYILEDTIIGEFDVKPNSIIVALEVPEKEGYTFCGWEGLPETMPPYDISVYGHYDLNHYRLTFKIGDEIIAEWDVEYGSEIHPPEPEEREGYTFEGWVDCPERMPSHDLTVNGSYKAHTYTLRFIIDDEVFSEQTLECGVSIVAPEVPDKEGYTFEGWEDYPETMPNYDLDITGNYRINSYQLTFAIDGEIIDSYEIEYGSEPWGVDAPEREGYTFNGWEGLPETMPSHDVTVTGSYTINSYRLVFKVGNEIVSESVVEYGSEIVEPEAPEKEGLSFAGWDEHPQTMPAYDLIINGHYEGNSYKLTYMIDGEVIAVVEVEFEANIDDFDAPDKEGYSFNGWEGLPDTMPGHDVTVTGSYFINSYTITFISDGEVISEFEVEYGSEIIAPDAPEREGYTFNGWEGVPETMPSHDVTVNASFTVNSYTLTFMLGWDELLSEETVEFGSEITYPEVPEKEGYTFLGWSDVVETMPAEDLIIYGTYEINTYTVTYVVDDEVIRVDYVEYGDWLPEAPDAPKKEDYDFVGWSEIPDTMPAHDIIVEGIYEYNAGLNSILQDSVKVDIYDIQGHLINKDVEPDKVSDSVPTGIYIINRQKVLIK